MKHEILCLAFLAAALPADAGDKNGKGPVDLTGNWKEAIRISPRKERLDYNDTTFYDFMVGNEYTVQRKNSYMYRGTHNATSGMLDLGMRTYSVLEMSHDRMVLRDDGGSYEFVRYDKSAIMAEHNSAASNSARAFKEEINDERITAAQLAGKWEVYKRTSSTPLSSIDYTRIIQVIDVKEAGGKIIGSVGSAKDMEGAPSWKITRYDGGVLYCTGKGDRQLKVIRCKGGELIVQEEQLTYFFKQFK